MKKVFTVTMMMLALVGSASATKYFCAPKAKDDNDGSSWENAVSINDLLPALQAIPDGDTVCIKGGEIKFKSNSDKWVIRKGITLIGGYNPDLTGTESTLPKYPSSTPTILNGDVNGDGKPSKGDASMLIRVELVNNRDAKVTIQGINMINTYYEVEGESTEDIDTYLNECSALRIICGTAFIKNCEIAYHMMPVNRGSQSVTVVGANVHLIDCDIHDSKCMSRGALVRTRSYFNNHTESDPVLPCLVVERCALYGGNAQGGQVCNAKGPYGGAIHASTGEIFAINSTFALDTCYSKGGAIRVNYSGIAMISCTMVENYCGRVIDEAAEKGNKYSYGNHLGLGDGEDHPNTPFKLANTFLLYSQDDGSKTNPPLYSDYNNTEIITSFATSGGYNVLGSVLIWANGSQVKDISSLWLTTDIYSSGTKDVKKFAPFFGNMSGFRDNGGCSKTILPLEMQKGDNVAHLQQLADEWFPTWTKVDASVDQRGAKRDVNETCVGAAAYEAGGYTALAETSQSARLNAQPCNILGQPVDNNYKGVVIIKGQKYLLR